MNDRFISHQVLGLKGNKLRNKISFCCQKIKVAQHSDEKVCIARTIYPPFPQVRKYINPKN